MSHFTDEELAKLPKWAQRRVEVLEREVEHWRGKVTAMDTGASNVALAGGLREDRVYLPNDSQIDFIMSTRKYGNGDYIREAFFSVEAKEHRGTHRQGDERSPSIPTLHVWAHYGKIAVYPISSNVVALEMDTA